MFGKANSDAEVIERARRSLRRFECWGRWTAAFHYGMAICLGLAIVWAGQFVINLAVGAQNRVELVFGLIIGVFFGTILQQGMHNLVTARLAHVPDQRDRLLIQYHDALIECVRSKTERGAEDADLEMTGSASKRPTTQPR